MDHSCRKIRQPWISFLSDWPLPAISLRLADVCCCSSMGGTSRIGTDTTENYTKHCFISSGRIRLPASGAPQRQVSYNCQIPLFPYMLFTLSLSQHYIGHGWAAFHLSSDLCSCWKKKKKNPNHQGDMWKRRLAVYSTAHAAVWWGRGSHAAELW